MARISYDPEMLANQLAKEFDLDRRDISCEKMHKDQLRPDKKSFDGIVIPFLIKNEDTSEQRVLAKKIFKKAMEIQGIDLGDEFSNTCFPIIGSYFAQNECYAGVCPKCQTRLRKTEQRRKDHVLVTLTCPNKPWCKWGTSRVVPLTGPRAALGLSVDHGEDLEATGTSSSQKPPMSGRTSPATFETEKPVEPSDDHAPAVPPAHWKSGEPMTIHAQSAKEDIVTEIDLQDWSTWPVGTIVRSKFTKQAELCRFENGNWVALIGGATTVLHQSSSQSDTVYWKVQQWDWRNWKPGSMVLSQNRGACRLEKYDPVRDAWLVTSMSDHCTLTLCLREETMLDEPVRVDDSEDEY